MMRRILASFVLAACVLAACGLSPSAKAQATGDRIDFYFADWHNATPRTTHGSLSERDIFPRGDPQNPTQKGAVLRYLNSYIYATLPTHASTKATRLEGQQEIY